MSSERSNRRSSTTGMGSAATAKAATGAPSCSMTGTSLVRRSPVHGWKWLQLLR